MLFPGPRPSLHTVPLLSATHILEGCRIGPGWSSGNQHIWRRALCQGQKENKRALWGLFSKSANPIHES